MAEKKHAKRALSAKIVSKLYTHSCIDERLLVPAYTHIYVYVIST